MESQRRIDLIEHADRDVAKAAAAVLDEISRPMTPAEMERELVPYYSRSKAREIVNALKFFDVVLLRADEGHPRKPGW